MAADNQPDGLAAAAGAGGIFLRELHGVIQVAMGWEGIHLYQFRLRAARYGSFELSASSPDVLIESLQLRKGARFTYEYDLNARHRWQGVPFSRRAVNARFRRGEHHELMHQR